MYCDRVSGHGMITICIHIHMYTYNHFYHIRSCSNTASQHIL